MKTGSVSRLNWGNNMAYSEIPASVVIRWCNKTLKRIEDKRKEKIGERVLYYMKPTTFMGITLYKGMSQDDAYAYVTTDQFTSKSLSECLDDSLATDYAWRQYRKVEDIKKLCQKAIDYNANADKLIKMSDDDLSYLITD